MVTREQTSRAVNGRAVEPSTDGTRPDPAIRLLCEPADLQDEVTEVMQRIMQLRQRPLFALVSDFIDDRAPETVYQWRKQLKPVGQNADLDILIHSPGGDLSACYRTARLFSRYTDAWEALVPRYAASGATLICLGSSKIILPPVAHLGPMDPQVISKRPTKFFAVERQSPLEAFQAVTSLQEVALTALNSFMVFLLRQQNVAPQPALETASKMAIQLTQPILEKIDPYDLGAFALDSGLATDYCRRVCAPAEGEKRTQRGAKFRTLVERYPAHEFVIDFSEAATLGLTVDEPTENLEDLFDELGPYLDILSTFIGLVPASQEGGA